MNGVVALKDGEPWNCEFCCRVTDATGEVVYTDEFSIRGVIFE